MASLQYPLLLYHCVCACVCVCWHVVDYCNSLFAGLPQTTIATTAGCCNSMKSWTVSKRCSYYFVCFICSTFATWLLVRPMQTQPCCIMHMTIDNNQQASLMSTVQLPVQWVACWCTTIIINWFHSDSCAQSSRMHSVTLDSTAMSGTHDHNLMKTNY